MKEYKWNLGFIIIGFLAFMLLGSDFIEFIRWWLAILVVGLIFMPLGSKVFSRLHDYGYLFTKVLGISITGYILWLLNSIEILKFTSLNAVMVLVSFAIINAFLFRYLKKNEEVSWYKRDKVLIYIKEELLFLGLLLIFTYIKGFKPGAYGTEKFMDFGFMASMARSDYMPPMDLWHSGESLNYYYFGQYIATFLSKLSFVNVSYGYNLMLTTIASLIFSFTYVISYNLWPNKDKRKSIASGTISACAVTFAGNMHYILYRWIIRSNYYFPNSTRYIGYYPDTNDKTIHEFPSYSLILGDLHAHVINIIFVLVTIGILLSWLKDQDSQGDKSFWGKTLNPSIILIGFYIGIFHMSNYWDFPIYYVVCGAVILFSHIKNYGFGKETIKLTAVKGLVILGVSKLIALPFTLEFDQISTVIKLVESTTPLYQLAVLWGLPILIVIAFTMFLKNTYIKDRTKIITFGDMFVLLISLCAIGLVFMPELIYVEDIYSGDFKRANTMFKLTYQAFVLFGISFGYIFIRLRDSNKEKYSKGRSGKLGLVKIVTWVLFALLVSTMLYSATGVSSWFGNVFITSNYKGIKATEFVEEEMPEDYLAIKWLNENVKGSPVLLEAHGNSYSDYQRVSAMTGLPTVLGWYTHEWLWRDDTGLLNVRVKDIEEIYTGKDRIEILDLIALYNISYIYVGGLEVEKYDEINHELIKGLGEVVYSSSNNAIDNEDTYIIKIKN